MAGAIWAFYSCSQGGMEDLRGRRVTMSQLDFRKLLLNVVGDCLPELLGHLRSNVPEHHINRISADMLGGWTCVPEYPTSGRWMVVAICATRSPGTTALSWEKMLPTACAV